MTTQIGIENSMRLDKNKIVFDFETSLLEAYRVKPDIKDFPPTLIVYVNDEILFITIDEHEKIPSMVQSANQKFRIEVLDKHELEFMH